MVGRSSADVTGAPVVDAAVQSAAANLKEFDERTDPFQTYPGPQSCSKSYTRWLQLRFDLDSTAVRLLIKGH